MIEEFLKSVSYNYESMSWCSILNSPQSPESSSLLLLEMFLQLGDNFFIDHTEVLFTIQVAFKKTRSDDSTISTGAYPQGDLLSVHVDVTMKLRRIVQRCTLASILIIDLRVHEKSCLVSNNKLFKESWLLIQKPLAES